jgi:DNA-binding XRE family transcriptional regulator
MKTSKTPVMLMNAENFISEFKQMLQHQKQEILFEFRGSKTKDLFTRSELAKYLKVSEQTIINWSAKSILKPVYIGNRVYYLADQVENLLNQ